MTGDPAAGPSGTSAPAPEPIRKGDIVVTGDNTYPRYEVIAVEGGKAWLRNVDTGHDGVVSLDHCCRVLKHAGEP